MMLKQTKNNENHIINSFQDTAYNSYSISDPLIQMSVNKE